MLAEDPRRRMFDVGIRAGMEKVAVSPEWAEKKIMDAVKSGVSADRLHDFANRMAIKSEVSHAMSNGLDLYPMGGDGPLVDRVDGARTFSKKQMDLARKRSLTHFGGSNVAFDVSGIIRDGRDINKRMKLDDLMSDHASYVPKKITPRAPAIAPPVRIIETTKKAPRRIRNKLIAAGALAALMAGGGYAYKKNKQR